MITQFGTAGISLILDKSAFQGLNAAEVELARRYFLINVPPILVLEILGDLQKNNNDQVGTSRVKDFAQKLSSFGTSTNAHFKVLMEQELLGNVEIKFYHPLVDTGEIVKNSDGKTGIFIKRSRERALLERWSDGDFSELDDSMADIWRTLTTDPKRIADLKNLWEQMIPKAKSLKNLEEILTLVDYMLTDPKQAVDCLHMLVYDFGFPIKVASEIFYRWQSTGETNIFKFAPYSMFCLRTSLFFNLALQLELITTRPTNLLDLEYLFYLPFCRVFVSEDKLHKRLAPHLLTIDQYFYTGKEIKNDLSKVISIRSGQDEQQRQQTWNEPPLDKNLIIYQIWNNIFKNWPDGEKQKLSEEDKKMLQDMITRFRNREPNLE